MTYFVTINFKDETVFTEPTPFETVDAAIEYIAGTDYFTPPDYPRNNAHAAIDQNGLARIILSPSSAGLISVPKPIKTILICRADVHLMDMTKTGQPSC